jgi:hypothetical protein
MFVSDVNIQTTTTVALCKAEPDWPCGAQQFLADRLDRFPLIGLRSRANSAIRSGRWARVTLERAAVRGKMRDDVRLQHFRF